MQPDREQVSQPLNPSEQAKDALHQMTKTEKKARSAALNRVYSILIEAVQAKDCTEFKWDERSMPWKRDETCSQWTCYLPPNRAVVILKKGHWFWDVYIERLASSKNGYNQFLRLEDAVAWAEEQLGENDSEDQETNPKASTMPEPRSRRSAMDLDPYRIDPSALEPGRITYRVVVEIDSAAERFKALDLTSGRQVRYDERYLSPGRLADELQIGHMEFELEQPIGPNDSWNWGQSVATYFRESIAIEQAQRMWNNSRIAEHFRQGRLLRARYGIKEVETGYVEWLGGCENPHAPWGEVLTRTVYLAHKAEELTLANALDVDGFREFIGIPVQVASDEQLLRALHRRCVDCPALSAERRAESKHWLKEHNVSR